MDWERIAECRDRYTKDTNELVKFLKKTAARMSCPQEWLQAPRTQGKDTKYVLHLNNFERIAKFLVTQDNFSVPADIMTAVDRGINLRKECNTIYETQGDKGPATCEANRRHKHFIKVLQKVRNMFLTKLASTPTHETAATQAVSGMKEPGASEETGCLSGMIMELSLLSKGLKGMRQTVKRCWSRWKVAANDDTVT